MIRAIPPVQLCARVAEMPDPDDVERLYAAASAAPPLSEPPSTARMFARLYRESREIPGAVAVTARAGSDLVGFGYGHPWSWSAATDAWSREPAARLGDAAELLDGSFAVEPLAVAPETSGVPTPRTAGPGWSWCTGSSRSRFPRRDCRVADRATTCASS